MQSLLAAVPGALGVPIDDEWMINNYKVLPCERKGAHSWTECPFTHPGEKAARRDPRTHVYSAEACPDSRKSGKCARGDLCPYSHGVFEQWLHPSRYRTQLCSFGTACRRPVCFFAHTVQELRVPTACGPTPAPAAAAAAAAAQQAAAAVAAACNHPLVPSGLEAVMQQALLAQLQAQPQLDGATATMINRYQAASCAALANAAACQRQQQQHQAAAAAAAAAAIAAAANNPASLLSMAQAAQAYQAAAAAAAAAAANMQSNAMCSGSMQPRGAGGLQLPMPPFSGASSGSGASSPTCSGSQQSGFPSCSSALFSDLSNASERSDFGAQSYLQHAFMQSAAACKAPGGPIGSDGGCGSPFLPWLPAGSAGAASPGGAQFGGCGYPSLLPSTPALSDASMGSGSASSASCSLDALAPHLQRQLSLQVFQN